MYNILRNPHQHTHHAKSVSSFPNKFPVKEKLRRGKLVENQPFKYRDRAITCK